MKYGIKYIDVEKAYCLTYTGDMTKAEARAEMNRLNQPTPEPQDFDKGFGIGGINRAQEKPTVPTAKQIGRYVRKVNSDTRCSVCGASKNFDGAMFTTGANGDICDDCF